MMSEKITSEVFETTTETQLITGIKEFEKDCTWEIKEFASYIDIFKSTPLVSEHFSSNYNYDTKFQLKIIFLNNHHPYEVTKMSGLHIKIIIKPSHDLKKCIIKSSFQGENVNKSTIWMPTQNQELLLLEVDNTTLQRRDLKESLIIKCIISEFYILSAEKPGFHRCILSNDFYKLHKDNILTDFTINVENVSFKVHKAILAARSTVFYAMFHHNSLEKYKNLMDITDIDPLAIKEMLRYIYTGTVENMKNFPFELLKAADKYQLEELKAICEKAFCNIGLKEVPSVLLFADKHSAQSLKEKALNFIRQHIQEIITTEEFAQLYPHEQLIKEILETVVNK